MIQQIKGCTMIKIKEYAKVFWVLGFVVFITGFLAGVLAIALIPTKPDASTQQLLIFAFGFITGIVVASSIYVVVKVERMQIQGE
jgi:uncharacterized membrane protein YciS (DUF1049 family)